MWKQKKAALEGDIFSLLFSNLLFSLVERRDQRQVGMFETGVKFLPVYVYKQRCC